MTRDELLAIVAKGEDSRRQCKADVTNAESFGADLVAPWNGRPSLEKWPHIDFSDDREGCLFTATVSRAAAMKVQDTGQVVGQVTGQVTREVALLLGIVTGDMARADLQRGLNLRGRANFENRYLRPALAAGLIEMTIPDKPNSRLQKYRLTEAGRRLLLTDAGVGEVK